MNEENTNNLTLQETKDVSVPCMIYEFLPQVNKRMETSSTKFMRVKTPYENLVFNSKYLGQIL